MARLTPLVPLFSPSEQLEVSAVAEKLESWLRGNTVPVGHEWHGVREVKAGQMGTATWELCRLIRNKVSIFNDAQCVRYAMIRTIRRAKTPKNFQPACYTALLVDEKAEPTVRDVFMEPGQSVWVDKPTTLGRNITFLVTSLPERMQLERFQNHVAEIHDLHRLQHTVDFYAEMVETKSAFVCPVPYCKKKAYTKPQGLYEHLTRMSKSDQPEAQLHEDLAHHRSPIGDRKIIDRAMSECLGRKVTVHPIGAVSFKSEFLIKNTYHAPYPIDSSISPFEKSWQDTQSQLHFLRHQYAFYDEVVQTNTLIYVCPVPRCAKRGFSEPRTLLAHFMNESSSRGKDDTTHEALSLFRFVDDDLKKLKMVNDAMAHCLGKSPETNWVDSDGLCFKTEFLVQQMFQPPSNDQIPLLTDESIAYPTEQTEHYEVTAHFAAI